MNESIKSKIQSHIDSLTDKLKTVDQKLESYLLDTNSNYEKEIKNMYSERDFIRSKLNKTKFALQNFKLKKKQKQKNIQLILEDIICTKSIIKYPLFWVGKNQEGNTLVYNTCPSEYNVWYHAKVRGGGLLATSSSQDSLMGAWALVYSKYLSTYGSLEGYISTTKSLTSTNVKGSFHFINPRQIKSTVEMIRLYVRVQEDKLIISYASKGDPFVLAPTNSNRFEKLFNKYNLNIKQITNKNLLQSFLPYKWDIIPL